MTDDADGTGDDREDGAPPTGPDAEAPLTLAENEAILHEVGELAPVFAHDRTYFVLGNYDPAPMRRLALVVDRLNRRPDAYAFRMADVRGDWENGIHKFRLIADLATHVVAVAEREPSGLLVEQGLLAGDKEHFEKTYVLKREYEREDETDGFDWMQRSVFDLADEAGRLHRWRTEEGLASVVEELP